MDYNGWFDLETKELSEEPVYLVDMDELKAHIQSEKKIDFKPSGKSAITNPGVANVVVVI